MTEQPGRYQRTSSGLLGSMIVLLLVVGVFLAIRGLARGDQDNPVSTVDYSLLLKQARSEHLLLTPVPAPMPDGWRATSVRYESGTRPTWHLGVLTGRKTYVGIEESRATADALVSAYLGKGADQGSPVTLDGAPWQSWTLGRGYALTRVEGASTVYVGGAAGRAAVTELAGRLDYGTVTPAPTG
jgi:hypothetical protein